MQGASGAPATTGQPGYRNPLALRLADGTLSDNCADPAIIRERGAAEPTWYLFCTTDPIDRRERDGIGWKFHLMPVFRSTDLQEWRYAGDAFDKLPALASPKAGLWAPDPQYFNGRYYLYFAITDLVDHASPKAGCSNDSAIAVATSASPAGPWTTSAQPVIAPRAVSPGPGSASGAGPAAAPSDGANAGCAFHWTIDPRAVETEDGAKYLYYGSYGGGMFVQRLSSDGLRATGQPVRVGASNRYEGAEVVRHGGWWYLFASSTDCCNGPLTGYALFAGRAKTPEGPFLDRHGNDMAAPRAGGTPVLVQNGNRWVGPGHNTVFQDEGGQWWTIYHAIDRDQPYFSARDKLTRRVALMDRIDWIDGWPVIAGGRGPSDGPLADARPAAGPAKASLLWADEFRTRRIGSRWRWLRTPPEGWRAGPDGVRLPAQAADLHHDTDNASVLNAALPAEGDYRIEARVLLDAPLDCCADPVQAGLVVYRDDDNYVKLVELAHRGLRQVEFAKEMFPVEPDHPRYGNTVVGSPGTWTWLRLDVRRDGAGELYTAWSSQDGRDWVRGGSWRHRLGPGARLGLVAMGGLGPTARIARVAVSRLQ